MTMESDYFVGEKVSVAGLTADANQTVSVDLSGSDYLGACGRTSTVACLRGGNASYESPDKYRMSMRTAAPSGRLSYKAAYLGAGTPDYYYDLDYLAWYYGDKDKAYEKESTAASVTADIDGDGRVTMKDYAYVTQALGCDIKTCDRRCIIRLSVYQANNKASCTVNDPSCNSTMCEPDASDASGYMGWERADFDGDGDVDMSDIISARYKGCSSVPPTGTDCGGLDLNGDGVVNASDLAMMGSVYSNSCSYKTCGRRCLVDTYDTNARVSVENPDTGTYSCLRVSGAIKDWRGADVAGGGDGKVGQDDMDFVKMHIGDGDTWETLKVSDLNGDGAIDLTDIGALQSGMGLSVTGTEGEYCLIDAIACKEAGRTGQSPFDPATDATLAGECCLESYSEPGKYILVKDADQNAAGATIDQADMEVMKSRQYAASGPRKRKDVKDHGMYGLGRVDWDKNGAANLNDLLFMMKGKQRCEGIHESLADWCTVCDDDGNINPYIDCN